MANDNYILNLTDQSDSFVVLPTSRNTETNLTFHGSGLRPYGKSLNENLLRLLENFASPEASGSPYIPGTPDPAYFDPSKAVKGQLWFNTTASTLMVYTGTEWIPIGRGTDFGAVAPGTPEQGDLWYDTNINQLMIWNGTAWESVADRYVLKAGDTMTGLLSLSADPTNPLHAATKQYVDNMDLLKVSKIGDTMTGDLTLPNDPTFPLHAATKQYVDTVLSGAISGAPVLLTGKTFVPLDNSAQIYYFQRNDITTQSFARTINIANYVADTGTPVTTAGAFPVPTNTTHVLVRIRFNVNIDGNIGTFVSARKQNPDPYVIKLSIDPVVSGGTFEGEHSVTVVMAVSATNTIDFLWSKSSAPDVWDHRLDVFIEGYYIQDQTGGMTQTDADARYVNVTGDTMTGDLNLGSNQLNFGALNINVGNGNTGVGADILANASMLLAATTGNVSVLVDGENNGVGFFRVGKGATVNGAPSEVNLLTVENTGRVFSHITNYETLVNADDVLTNKKYVDDKVAAGASTGTVKAVAKFYGNGTSAPVVQYSYNVSSIVRLSVGKYRINYTTSLPTHYAAVGDCRWETSPPDASNGFYFNLDALTSGYAEIGLVVNGFGNDNKTNISFIAAR